MLTHTLSIRFESPDYVIPITKVFRCWECFDSGVVSDSIGDHWSEFGEKPCICQL